MLLLQLLWHGVLFPSTGAPAWLVTTLFALPIVPATWLLAKRHRHAPFWSAVAALFYFSHGLMEAWAVPQTRWLALAEAALALELVAAASWTGVRTRFTKNR